MSSIILSITGVIITSCDIVQNTALDFSLSWSGFLDNCYWIDLRRSCTINDFEFEFDWLTKIIPMHDSFELLHSSDTVGDYPSPLLKTECVIPRLDRSSITAPRLSSHNLLGRLECKYNEWHYFYADMYSDSSLIVAIIWENETDAPIIAIDGDHLRKARKMPKFKKNDVLSFEFIQLSSNSLVAST